MAKISERLLSTNILREKRRDSFNPQRVNLLFENTAKRKDRHLLGSSLCHPYISCLSEAIQIKLYPKVFANRLIC